MPREVYRELLPSKRLPTGTAVFGKSTPDLPPGIVGFSSLQIDRFPVFSTAKTIRSFARCKIGLRLGVAQLLFVYWSDPDWRLVAWRDVHRPVWTTTVDRFYSHFLSAKVIARTRESAAQLFALSLGITNISQERIDLIRSPQLEEQTGLVRRGSEI